MISYHQPVECICQVSDLMVGELRNSLCGSLLGPRALLIMEHDARCSQQEVPKDMIPACSFLCPLPKGSCHQVAALGVYCISGKAHTFSTFMTSLRADVGPLTLAIRPKGNLQGTLLEEGLLSSAHMSSVGCANPLSFGIFPGWDTRG